MMVNAQADAQFALVRVRLFSVHHRLG